MEYQNTTSRFLREAFPIPSFDSYVKQRLEELARPLACPRYALEAEKEQLAKLHQFIQQNPYAFFERFNVMVNQMFEAQMCEMITTQSDPVYFDCLNTCCDALGFSNMTGYVYGEEGVVDYNAMATGYLDMSWVFMSKSFRQDDLLDDLELTFILGHELGHVAGMHTSISVACSLEPEENRNHEYTADRAGLLAVLWRVEKQNPGCEPRALYAKALESCTRVFHKLHILANVKSKERYTGQLLKLRMSDPKCAIPVEKSRRKDSHPTNYERAEALGQYIKSMDFAECIHAMWGKEHGASLKL